MRSFIFQALVSDSALNILGINSADSFAVDVDTPQSRPFLQMRWGRNDEGLRYTSVTERNLTIWVHDQPGDYGRIDSIISRIRALLPTLVPGDLGTGGWLMAVEWAGDSEDLTDEGHRTITRNTSFVLVGSGQ